MDNFALNRLPIWVINYMWNINDGNYPNASGSDSAYLKGRTNIENIRGNWLNEGVLTVSTTGARFVVEQPKSKIKN